MKKYLGKDYEEYVRQGWTLSEDDCETLFKSKLADATKAADTLYGEGGPFCPCARASAIDVIYDMSPDIALVAPSLENYHQFLREQKYE